LPYNLGLLYIRIGDAAEAQQWFESADRIAVAYPRKQDGRWPERASILNAIGTLAVARRDPAAARRYFDAALTADPRNPDARQNEALLAAAGRDYIRADQIWLDLMRDSPDYIEAPVARAESLAQRGDRAGAIQQYKEVLMEKPDWPGAHEALAKLYLSSGDAANALVEADSALSRASPNPFLLELRGDAEFQLHRATDARVDWNNALAHAPDKATASRIKRKLKQNTTQAN
jgi:tetratricopeptide (TPR) repeat protein